MGCFMTVSLGVGKFFRASKFRVRYSRTEKIFVIPAKAGIKTLCPLFFKGDAAFLSAGGACDCYTRPPLVPLCQGDKCQTRNSRKRESRLLVEIHWIPAFAGMTGAKIKSPNTCFVPFTNASILRSATERLSIQNPQSGCTQPTRPSPSLRSAVSIRAQSHRRFRCGSLSRRPRRPRA